MSEGTVLNVEQYPDIKYLPASTSVCPQTSGFALSKTWCSPWQDVGEHVSLRPALPRSQNRGVRDTSLLVPGKMALLLIEAAITKQTFPQWQKITCTTLGDQEDRA